MKLYVAYGSNLNKQQMRHRCPSAKPVYTGYLNNWELIYRGSKTGSYATIRRKKGYRDSRCSMGHSALRRKKP